MGSTSRSGQWYVADLVLAIDVRGDERSVTHVETLLVRATTPEEAYTAAMHLGHEHEDEYENPAGIRVCVKFLGVADLNAVGDVLEHGAELCFAEHIGLTESQQRALVRPKGSLGVFAERRPTDRPDYSSGEVFGDAVTLIRRMLPRSDG